MVWLHVWDINLDLEKFKEFKYEVKKQARIFLRFFHEIEEVYILARVSNPSQEKLHSFTIDSSWCTLIQRGVGKEEKDSIWYGSLHDKYY